MNLAEVNNQVFTNNKMYFFINGGSKCLLDNNEVIEASYRKIAIMAS